MSDLKAIRARYLAQKIGSNRTSVKMSQKVRQAKADRRARAFIERWLAGETYQQIADSEGVCRQNITACITKYRKRHPDTPIPRGPHKREDGEWPA